MADAKTAMWLLYWQEYSDIEFVALYNTKREAEEALDRKSLEDNAVLLASGLYTPEALKSVSSYQIKEIEVVE